MKQCKIELRLTFCIKFASTIQHSTHAIKVCLFVFELSGIN